MLTGGEELSIRFLYRLVYCHSGLRSISIETTSIKGAIILQLDDIIFHFIVALTTLYTK